jgi:hypothetical protein
LSSAGLLLVLVYLGTGIANQVVVPHSATVNWVVSGIAVAIAVGTMLVARRWATPAS